ncbi:hypothetical protein C8A00DRAFT_36310 [Chaetomidium leptoderma]|uniref:Uncharacterized protein n=1 Tax=Chaetomidium leptoderma TaxID=669021 RepID=A0AAN6VHS2_9PEZI|nr:hypothetical protein C8A00DRAFT_36310 [Chaetomidium leptoderma]
MLSITPRRAVLGHGPRIAASKSISVQTVGSVPHLQAQVADFTQNLDTSANSIPPGINRARIPEVAHPPVRPVAAALPQNQDEFWRKVPLWRDVSAKEFLSYRWSTKNLVDNTQQLFRFLQAVLPEEVPLDKPGVEMQTRDDFIQDVVEGIKAATMSVRMTPYILSRIDWRDPRHDPIAR